MIVKLLTEHHLEFLSVKGGCRGSLESTHVKIPHCWKSLYMWWANAQLVSAAPTDLAVVALGVVGVGPAVHTVRRYVWAISINLGMGGTISVVLAVDIVGLGWYPA